jgi:hypothetical protein
MSPHWGPDSDEVAFSVVLPGGYCGIYLVRIDGTAPRRLSTLPRHELLTAWSRDGEWLYFDVDHGDGWQAWKMRPVGTGAELVAGNVHDVNYETTDRQQLYHFRTDRPGLWSTAPHGGEPTCIVEGGLMARWIGWAPVDDGVYFVDHPGGGRNRLAFFEFSTGEVDSIATVPRGGGTHLAVSPAGQSFLYDVTENHQCDLILVEELP